MARPMAALDFNRGFLCGAVPALKDSTAEMEGNRRALRSTNNNFWGMYANGGAGDNAAVAYRALTNSLPINTVFKIKWRPRGIGFDATI